MSRTRRPQSLAEKMNDGKTKKPSFPSPRERDQHENHSPTLNTQSHTHRVCPTSVRSRPKPSKFQSLTVRSLLAVASCCTSGEMRQRVMYPIGWLVVVG